MALDNKLMEKVFNQQKKSSVDSLSSLGKSEARRKIVRLEYEEKEQDPSPLVTNKEPIGNQMVTIIDNQKVIDRESIGNQTVTNEKPLVTNKEPIGNPIGSHHRLPIGNPLVTSLVTNSYLPGDVKKVCGLQRKILSYIVECCANRGQLTTDIITNEFLRILCNTTGKTIKTAIHRLKKKGLIKSDDGKRGNGGFSTFKITEAVRNELLEMNKKISIGNQLVTPLVTTIGNRLVTNRLPDRESSPSSSSSYIYNKTTTTDLPQEWENIDLSEATKNFDFGISHIRQVQRDGILTPQQVEDSLIHFNYDFENAKLSSVEKPLNYLMKVLRLGSPYVSDYYRQEQKRIREEMAKRRGQLEQEKALMEQEKFLEWLHQQPTEDVYNQIIDSYAREEWQKKGTRSSIAINWVKSNIYDKESFT